MSRRIAHPNFRSVSQEERDILDRGEVFADFVKHPAWKILLDAVEQKADEVLAEHRKFSNDPNFSDKQIAESARVWSITEEAFEFIQHQVIDPIADRENLLKELQREAAMGGINLVNPSGDEDGHQ